MTNREKGRWAEQWAAETLGVEHDPDTADWYDLVGDDGEKYEAKSADVEVGLLYVNEGRFRIFRSNHRSLASSPGTYVFMKTDTNGATAEVVDYVTRPASWVTEKVAELGGWNESGHERYAEEIKLPISEVF